MMGPMLLATWNMSIGRVACAQARPRAARYACSPDACARRTPTARRPSPSASACPRPPARRAHHARRPPCERAVRARARAHRPSAAPRRPPGAYKPVGLGDHLLRIQSGSGFRREQLAPETGPLPGQWPLPHGLPPIPCPHRQRRHPSRPEEMSPIRPNGRHKVLAQRLRQLRHVHADDLATRLRDEGLLHGLARAHICLQAPPPPPSLDTHMCSPRRERNFGHKFQPPESAQLQPLVQAYMDQHNPANLGNTQTYKHTR